MTRESWPNVDFRSHVRSIRLGLFPCFLAWIWVQIVFICSRSLQNTGYIFLDPGRDFKLRWSPELDQILTIYGPWLHFRLILFVVFGILFASLRFLQLWKLDFDNSGHFLTLILKNWRTLILLPCLNDQMWEVPSWGKSASFEIVDYLLIFVCQQIPMK